MEEEGVNMRRMQGFTLVELLVVMIIIGVLAGLLLPAVSRARVAAQRADAQAQVTSIQAAVKAYVAEYGKFPHGNGQRDWNYGATAVAGWEDMQGNFAPDEENKWLINALRGVASSAGNPSHANNPRRTLFLEVSLSALEEDNLLDPWGNQYRITCDTDFDNACDAGGSVGEVEGRTVLVWSLGHKPKGKAPNDYIKSWD